MVGRDVVPGLEEDSQFERVLERAALGTGLDVRTPLDLDTGSLSLRKGRNDHIVVYPDEGGVILLFDSLDIARVCDFSC
jgi:hypothetical protein